MTERAQLACRPPRCALYTPMRPPAISSELRYALGGYAHAGVQRDPDGTYRVYFSEARSTSGPWETEQEAAEYAALASGLKLTDNPCTTCTPED